MYLYRSKSCLKCIEKYINNKYHLCFVRAVFLFLKKIGFRTAKLIKSRKRVKKNSRFLCGACNFKKNDFNHLLYYNYFTPKMVFDRNVRRSTCNTKRLNSYAARARNKCASCVLHVQCCSDTDRGSIKILCCCRRCSQIR